MCSYDAEKSFKCDSCGVYFAQCELLNEHLLTHVEDKPFKL